MTKKIALEPYRGYRPVLENGVYVWYRIMPAIEVGKQPGTGLPMKFPRSGFRDVNLRVQTNTGDLEIAKQMLDNKLRKPVKENPFKKGPDQTSMF